MKPGTLVAYTTPSGQTLHGRILATWIHPQGWEQAAVDFAHNTWRIRDMEYGGDVWDGQSLVIATQFLREVSV